MKHRVIKVFTDKESGMFYMLGSFYICDNYERVKELGELGFIIPNEQIESLKTEFVKETQPTKRNTRNKKKVSDEDVRKN